MTYQEAIDKLKELGWCCSPTHPHSPFKRYLAGPRANTESYGPFPDGWVSEEWGTGDTFVEAVEAGIRKWEQARDRAIDLDIDHAEHPEARDGMESL